MNQPTVIFTPEQKKLLRLAALEALKDHLETIDFEAQILELSWDTSSFSEAVALMGDDKLVSELSAPEAAAFDDLIREALRSFTTKWIEEVAKELP